MAQNLHTMQTIRDFIKNLKENANVLALSWPLAAQSFVVHHTYFSQHTILKCLTSW
jgi:hypothetical protein